MEYSIVDVGSDSMVRISLEDGESVVAQRGAIAAKSPSVSAATGTGQGGLRGAVKSSVTSGSADLQNTLTAEADSGWVELTLPFPADIRAVELEGNAIYTRAHTYLGGGPELDVDYEAGNKIEFFKNDGIAFTKVSGNGVAFVAALGGGRAISLDGSDVYGVGVQHVVSFDATLNYTLTNVGDMSASLIGGEGKVCEFNGTGEIIMQTSSRDGLREYINAAEAESGGLSSVLNR